jgi:xanthine dehydrogenase accessory factor
MDTAVFQRLAALPDEARAVLAVVVRVEGSAYRREGAVRLWVPEGSAEGVVSGGCVEGDLEAHAATLDWTGGRGRLVRYDLRGDDRDLWGLGVGCNGLLEVWLQPIPAGRPSAYRTAARWLVEGHPVAVWTDLADGTQGAEATDGSGLSYGPPRPAGARGLFVDRREPPPLFAVCGRGPDAGPLVDLARRVGFRVCQLGRSEALTGLGQRPAAVVVMHHHFEADRQAVAAALALGVPYVGVLGPRERTRRLCPEPWPPQLHAPVGLDIGADGAEEIAVAVVAEALAVLRGASAGFLCDRPGPIHRPRAAGVPAEA